MLELSSFFTRVSYLSTRWRTVFGGWFLFLSFSCLVSYQRGPAYHDGPYAMVSFSYSSGFCRQRNGGKEKPAELFLFPILRVSYPLIYVCLVFVFFMSFALIIMCYALFTMSLDALHMS